MVWFPRARGTRGGKITTISQQLGRFQASLIAMLIIYVLLLQSVLMANEGKAFRLDQSHTNSAEDSLSKIILTED